jgi:hypothetical protein
MVNADFARIRNAKPLLLTEAKRVMQYPATGKVRIDNNVNYEPKYRRSAEKASREEFSRAKEVASLPQRITPPVNNYTEKGNLHTYTQDYGGSPVDLNAMNAKQKYKLGSQIGRQQNALKQNGLGHTDLHSGNIVKPNPKKNKAYLIDNESFNKSDNYFDTQLLKYPQHRDILGKPFMTGYNSRINFTQHKQMQHFANFAFTNPLPSMLNKAQPYLNNAKAAGGALKDTAQVFGASRGVQVGAGLGAAAGLARGAGIGESEEERANTTGLGRLGKVLGNTAAGGVVGGSLGLAGENAARVSNQMYKRRKAYQTMDDLA